MNVNEILKYVSYCPYTGLYRWIIKRNKMNVGDIAGTIHPSGYVRIGVGGKYYNAHRLAWLIFYGEEAEDKIDHIDGNRSNNKISNLRLSNNFQNNQNRAMLKNNTSGVKGVSLCKKTGKWKASCMVNLTHYYLGSFNDIEEARDVVSKFRTKNHKDFANHGEFKQ